MAWTDSGDVIELGGGVGNLSRLIHGEVRGRYTRTDISMQVLTRAPYGDEQRYYDFDQPPPRALVRSASTVVAVNALHCSADITQALMHARKMLKPGGALLLAEGQADPAWPFHYVFGMFDGWWDRGGFKHRDEWLRALQCAGFRDIGYSVMRAGRHDLGGLLWASV